MRRRLDVTEGLVGVLTAVGVGHGVFVCARARVRGVVLVAVGRLASTQGLVGVRGLLGDEAAGAVVTGAVVVGRAAGAAAHAEGPEDQGGEGEDDGEPGGGVHVLTHAEGDAVGLEGVAGATLHDGEEDGRGHGGGGGEQEGQEGEEGGDTAAPAAADGEEAQQDLQAGGDEGDDVGDEHPLRDDLVNLHELAVFTGQLLLHGRIVQTPDLERVEIELAFRLGTLGSVVLVVVVDVSIAVAPETDRVEVAQGAVTLQLGKHI